MEPRPFFFLLEHPSEDVWHPLSGHPLCCTTAPPKGTSCDALADSAVLHAESPHDPSFVREHNA
jgi:hypothetical protein